EDSELAGIVDARPPARRICSSCDRIHFSHVPTIRGRDRPAGRRGFSSLNAWHHGRRGVIMTWQMASLLLLGGSTVLLFAGMPVAISFIAINLIGAFLFLGGGAGLHQVAPHPLSTPIHFSLPPLPPFLPLL